MEMHSRAMSYGSERLDGEFIPPVDEPASWAVPWARQLDAALAWQQAAAEAADDADQWQEPARAQRTADAPPLTVQTVVRMNTLSVSLRERLLRIMSEASNIAIAEMAERKDAPAERAHPEAPLGVLAEDRAQRLVELARAWFDLVGNAQASMSALTGVAPRSRATVGERPLVDRRQRVLEIDFADRRKTG